MLPPSIRNTLEAQKLLFQRVDCRLLVYANQFEQTVSPLLASMPELAGQTAPDFEEILESSVVVPHFHPVSLEKDQTVIIFHSSGSSGAYPRLDIAQ
jgi:hypothetical protein